MKALGLIIILISLLSILFVSGCTMLDHVADSYTGVIVKIPTEQKPIDGIGTNYAMKIENAYNTIFNG